MSIKLLNAPKEITAEEFKEEVIRRMAIIFQVPVDLLKNNYEKNNRN